MSEIEFIAIITLVAMGCLCAGWLWGMRDCDQRLARLGDKIQKIRHRSHDANTEALESWAAESKSRFERKP